MRYGEESLREHTDKWIPGIKSCRESVHTCLNKSGICAAGRGCLCRVDYAMGADGPVMRSLDDGTEQDVDVWLAVLPDRTEEFLPRLADSDKEILFCLR